MSFGMGLEVITFTVYGKVIFLNAIKENIVDITVIERNVSES
jgi:hypothetical protein